MENNLIRVFIGYDPREHVAFRVLAESIYRRSSKPVSICPLIGDQLPVDRSGGSTAFAFTRFLVPWLCNYEGHAIFMDCDMLCRADIGELWEMREPVWKLNGPAVKVVQHDYQPQEGTKFLGEKQQPYDRKNWSSVMLFDNTKCRTLTPEYVQNAPGLDLHQLKWAASIGELPERWNYLVNHSKDKDPALVHFTEGGPWFFDFRAVQYADEWFAESTNQTNPLRESRR